MCALVIRLRELRNEDDSGAAGATIEKECSQSSAILAGSMLKQRTAFRLVDLMPLDLTDEALGVLPWWKGDPCSPQVASRTDAVAILQLEPTGLLSLTSENLGDDMLCVGSARQIFRVPSDTVKRFLRNVPVAPEFSAVSGWLLPQWITECRKSIAAAVSRHSLTRDLIVDSRSERVKIGGKRDRVQLGLDGSGHGAEALTTSAGTSLIDAEPEVTI